MSVIISSKATQLTQAANMTNEETHKLAQVLMGNNRELAANTVRSMTEQYETNSRAKKLGDKIAEIIISSK